MDYKEISKGILRSIAILTAICIGLFLLNEIQILISYLIIAAVVSLIGRPFVNFFTNKLKLKNTTASILTLKKERRIADWYLFNTGHSRL